MKTVQEAYPEYKDGEDGPSSYQPMLESFEHEILVQVDDADYQGDTRVLFKSKEGKYGWLVFGWGSCSGCDSLQAVDSFEGLAEIQRDLEANTKWFGTLDEVLKAVDDKISRNDWDSHSKETKRFREKVSKIV